MSRCAQCHKNNVFAGLPTACVSCHLTNFNGTTNPNHVAAGFSQNCGACHTSSTWQGATFNHNNTPFPLTGAHINVVSLCPVPQKQPVCRAPDCVRILPSDGFQWHDESESRVGGIPAGLQPVSFNDELARRSVQPQQYAVPLDRRSYQCRSLYPVPQKQRVRRTLDRVRILPSDGFQRHDQSESRVGRIPAGLQPVPFNDELARRNVQPQQYAVPIDRRSYQCRSLCPVS